MDFQYNIEKCNIKNCNNIHYSLFLCKQHYNQYIINVEIEEIQSNLYRYYLKKELTLRDWLRYQKYSIIHYTTTSHVYYIEHFPLETLFIYHSKLVSRKENTTYTLEQFIEDFDYDENFKLDYLRTMFKTADSNKGLNTFSQERSTNLAPNIFNILYSLYLLIFLFSSIYYKDGIHYYTNFYKILFIFFLCIPIVKVGLKFRNSTRDIIQDALEHKLYTESEDNETFLKNSQGLITMIKSNAEMRLSMYGNFTFSSLFLIVGIYIDLKNESIYDILITITLSVLVVAMSLILFSVVWNNRYILPISRRLHNGKLRMRLYALDKSIGINKIKYFLRNLTLYNLFVVCTFYFTFFLFEDAPYSLVIFFIMAFILGWSISSFYFIIKIYKNLNKQFKQEVTDEKNLLDNSESSERFEKYNFLENLKLDLFYKKESILKALTFISRFALTLFIKHYDKQLISAFKNIFFKYI